MGELIRPLAKEITVDVQEDYTYVLIIGAHRIIFLISDQELSWRGDSGEIFQYEDRGLQGLVNKIFIAISESFRVYINHNKKQSSPAIDCGMWCLAVSGRG